MRVLLSWQFLETPRTDPRLCGIGDDKTFNYSNLMSPHDQFFKCVDFDQDVEFYGLVPQKCLSN